MFLKKARTLLIRIKNPKSEKSSEEAFTEIYNQGVWGYNEDLSPSSGTGSRGESIPPYADFVTTFLKEHKIKSVVDAGCGDWNLSRHISWEGIHYTGFDCVKSVIERNNQLYAQERIIFNHADFLKITLPSADLLLCKDVLQHLFCKDIKLFLKRIAPFKHCLITNDIISPNKSVGDKNRDLADRGQARPLDLSKPPFKMKGTRVLTYIAIDHVKQVFHIQNF